MLFFEQQGTSFLQEHWEGVLMTEDHYLAKKKKGELEVGFFV